MGPSVATMSSILPGTPSKSLLEDDVKRYVSSPERSEPALLTASSSKLLNAFPSSLPVSASKLHSGNPAAAAPGPAISSAASARRRHISPLPQPPPVKPHGAPGSGAVNKSPLTLLTERDRSHIPRSSSIPLRIGSKSGASNHGQSSANTTSTTTTAKDDDVQFVGSTPSTRKPVHRRESTNFASDTMSSLSRRTLLSPANIHSTRTHQRSTSSSSSSGAGGVTAGSHTRLLSPHEPRARRNNVLLSPPDLKSKRSHDLPSVPSKYELAKRKSEQFKPPRLTETNSQSSLPGSKSYSNLHSPKHHLAARDAPQRSPLHEIIEQESLELPHHRYTPNQRHTPVHQQKQATTPTSTPPTAAAPAATTPYTTTVKRTLTHSITDTSLSSKHRLDRYSSRLVSPTKAEDKAVAAKASIASLKDRQPSVSHTGTNYIATIKFPDTSVPSAAPSTVSAERAAHPRKLPVLPIERTVKRRSTVVTKQPVLTSATRSRKSEVIKPVSNSTFLKARKSEIMPSSISSSSVLRKSEARHKEDMPKSYTMTDLSSSTSPMNGSSIPDLSEKMQNLSVNKSPVTSPYRPLNRPAHIYPKHSYGHKKIIKEEENEKLSAMRSKSSTTNKGVPRIMLVPREQKPKLENRRISNSPMQLQPHIDDEIPRLMNQLVTSFDNDVEVDSRYLQGTEPITAAHAARSGRLNIFEKGEILDYRHVYFCGRPNTQKISGDIRHAANNYGFDDENGDYTAVPGDHIAYRYEILNVLGKGSFGKVLKCIDHKNGKLVAVKMTINRATFHNQALIEADILRALSMWDVKDKYHLIRYTAHFSFREHLCISTELLGINLYELLKFNKFKGLDLRLIRHFTKQLLEGLRFLDCKEIIHCDLKPENILLSDPERGLVKIIDFGSSCFVTEKSYTYIQSRFYRAPEVILGMDYDQRIDVWSLGCIISELFTSYPLFVGKDEKEVFAGVMEIFGVPDRYMINQCRRRKLYFDSVGNPLPVSKKYPGTKSLQRVMKCSDADFLSFVSQCLVLNPKNRLSPYKGLNHPFVNHVAAAPGSAASMRRASLHRGMPVHEPRPLPSLPVKKA